MKKLTVFAACAAMCAFAGENLVRNGTFEGTATAKAWGSYANASGFSCEGWEFLAPNKAGLGKPGTWVASGLAVGDFALFIQTSSGSGQVIVQQTIAAVTSGTYRVAFSYTGRPKYYANVTNYVELVWSGGRTFSLGSVIPEGTALYTFSQDVDLPSGDYTLRFRQPQTAEDRAVCFEGVSMTRIDGADGIAGAMSATAPGETLPLDTDGAGNATLSGQSIVWSGHMPTLAVSGALTFVGANTIAAYASAPGTYTLFTADSVTLASGATLALDSSTAADGLVRTLAVGETAVTLTVARDPDRAEMVVNGDFDVPGTFAGLANANAPGWSYSYDYGGFCIPWWQYGIDRCGMAQAGKTWLASGQTNGGTYSYFMQRSGTAGPDPLVQDFGATPAGVYVFSFNCAPRPGYTGSAVLASVRKDGAAVHTLQTAALTDTALAEVSQVVAIPSAGNFGLAFDMTCQTSADRALALDDVSFLRSAVAGWSVADGVATLSGTAEVPPRSFVAGDAEIASGAVLSMAGDILNPALAVSGALTVKGPVTVTLPSSYASLEGDYTLIEAGTLAFDEGASFALDSASALVDDGTTVHEATLETSGGCVYLRMRNTSSSGTDNLRKSASACADTLWATAANWSLGHVPQSGDGNVVFNHPGTVTFDGAYANDAGLKWYVRNGQSEPLVLAATDGAYGFTSTVDCIYGAQGSAMSGWLEFSSGTYVTRYMYLPGSNNASTYGRFRLDATGATLNLTGCLQFNYSTGCESAFNVSAGAVTVALDYNTNIRAWTKHVLRVTGGSLTVRNLQAGDGVYSTFDGEVSGGEFTATACMKFYSRAGTTTRLRLSGGLVRTPAITVPDDSATFLFDGGALAPYAASTVWLEDTALVVTAGKSAVVDTEGKDVTWCATLADASGGNSFGFTKRGSGTLTFAADPTFAGLLSVEGGTVMATVSLASASGASVADGATLSAADGTAGQTVTLAALALAGGARLAVDVSADAADAFSATSLDLSGATSANPVTIVVNPIGITEIDEDAEYTVIASGLSSADAEKFAVNGIDATLAVKNGALVLASSSRAKVTTEWSGAAGDGGKWSTAGNWTGGATPQNGDTAAFNLAAGGETAFDVGGLALGAVVFGPSAGAFTHGGDETIRVTGAVTNESASAQTFAVPATLGVDGQPFEVVATGDVAFTNATTCAAGTLTKKGAGALSASTSVLRGPARIDVEAGALRVSETSTTDESAISAAVTVGGGAALEMTLAGTGDANTFTGPLAIGSGATVTATAAQRVVFTGAVTNAGTFAQTSGNIHFNGPALVGGAYTAGGSHVWMGGTIDSPESEITIGGTGHFVFGSQLHCEGTGLPRLGRIRCEEDIGDVHLMPRASCEVTNGLFDAAVAHARCLYVDGPDNAVTVTVRNATWSPRTHAYVGYDNRSGALVLGDGATLAVSAGNSLIMGINCAQPSPSYLEVAAGGTIDYPGANNYFQIGRGNSPGTDTNAAPQRLAVTGGTVNAPAANLLVGAFSRVAYADLSAGLMKFAGIEVRQTVGNSVNWRNAHEARFTQTGGTLELGANGFWSAWPDARPQADLADGALVAAGALANRYGYENVQFGADPSQTSGAYTVDLNGQDVQWNVPLQGMSAVTVTGSGSFSSAAALQSIPLGRWTVTNTTATADLSGAAGFAGGLTLAPGCSAKVAVAGEGLVEWGVFPTNLLENIAAMQGYTGVLPYVGTSLARVHTPYASATAKQLPNHTCLLCRGQFYVDDDKAGTWHFAGNYDDQIGFEVDGAEVFASDKYNVAAAGSVELSAGWHDFRVMCLDFTGGSGPSVSSWKTAGMAVGWTTDASAAGSTDASLYATFDTSTLSMRLPQGAAAQTAVRVRATPASGDISAYMDEVLPFSVLDCVTNDLALLHAHAGDSVASVANSATVRYEGSFLVEEANAGTWTFTGQYDDKIQLVVDGEEVFATTAYNAAKSGSCALAAGWHAFRISVADATVSYGGMLTDDDGTTCAIKVKAANAAKTLAFDGANFRLAYSASDAQKACAAGLGGVTCLGAGATLSNDCATGYCPIYGTLKGAGALKGRFAFTGTDNCIAVTGASGKLTEKPNLDGVTNGDRLSGLAKVSADFSAGKPTAKEYDVCAAGELTAAAAAEIAVEATLPDGTVETDWSCTVRNGRLLLANPHPSGVVIVIH